MAKSGLCTRSLPGLTDLLSVHRHDPRQFPFLLESVATALDGSCPSRYDLLFAFPGDSLVLQPDGTLQGSDGAGGDFLQALDRRWAAQAIEDNSDESELPFRGGWFIYLGYELAGQIEPRLNLPMPRQQAVACATRIPAAIVVDRHTQTTWLVAEEPEQLEKLEGIIAEPCLSHAASNILNKLNVEEAPADDYLHAVNRVKEYIFEGDVFQVNLSRRWMASCPDRLQPAEVYSRLREQNPAPFAGLACFDWGAVISSSPERLVRVQQGRVETRPIAGTRRREKDTEADSALKKELIGHPKERAEHIMLIDLERNDLGKVCRPGSIRVDELMVLESYAHVHHIVSNVSGQLRDDVTPGEVIRAVFPGGTITGCPKERCMAIIAELEQTARGAYTGSMGYLNHNGDMDLNILIRTITIDDQHLSLRAGAGLVADSVPEAELEETRHKARGLLLALGIDNDCE